MLVGIEQRVIVLVFLQQFEQIGFEFSIVSAQIRNFDKGRLSRRQLAQGIEGSVEREYLAAEMNWVGSVKRVVET